MTQFAGLVSFRGQIWRRSQWADNKQLIVKASVSTIESHHIPPARGCHVAFAPYNEIYVLIATDPDIGQCRKATRSS